MASLLSSLKRTEIETSHPIQVTAPLYSLINPTKVTGCEESVSSIQVTYESELKDLNQFTSLEEFSKELEIHTEKNKKSVSRKRKQDSDIVHRPPSSYISESCICRALQKCSENNKFWSRKGLISLIQQQYISPKVHNAVFACILKYDALDLLKTFVKHMIKISEKHIIQCIKHIIRSIPKENIEKLGISLQWEECPVKSELADNLIILLQFDFNDIILKEHMKILNADEALVLLQFLHYVLHIVSPALISNTEKDIIVPEDITETKVMSWIDALLAAHLLSFTISPTLKELVSQLKRTTVKQRYFYRDVATLAPYIERVKKNMILPEKSIGKYAIETIKL